jgi:hypothetical protein
MDIPSQTLSEIDVIMDTSLREIITVGVRLDTLSYAFMLRWLHDRHGISIDDKDLATISEIARRKTRSRYKEEWILDHEHEVAALQGSNHCVLNIPGYEKRAAELREELRLLNEI